jgi:hypothetical protein
MIKVHVYGVRVINSERLDPQHRFVLLIRATILAYTF